MLSRSDGATPGADGPNAVVAASIRHLEVARDAFIRGMHLTSAIAALVAAATLGLEAIPFK